MPASLFYCPYCQSDLIIQDKTWRCDGRLHQKHICHPFDVARQGYVNLLPVQHKKSKEPGDSAESIMARQRFLEQGFYQPLRTTLIGMIEQYLPKVCDDKKGLWLDVGCGDGYYTDAIAHIQEIPRLIAIDISKPAVSATAKRFKKQSKLWWQAKSNQTINNQKHAIEAEAPLPTGIYPIVSSAAQLPISDGSIHGVSSIFSPILPDEFARVLQAGGLLIIAKPDINHLASMRQELFEQVRSHDSDKFLEHLSTDFELLATEQVSSQLALSASQLQDLLTMTPYSYRAKVQRRQALLAKAQISPFITEAKFIIYVLQHH